MFYTNAYKYNPLSDHPARQVSYLFTRMAELIEEAERHRQNGEFEHLAHKYQRVFSLMEGLLSWLNVEIAASQKQGSQNANSANADKNFVLKIAPSTKWDDYFKMLMMAMRHLILQESPTVYAALLQNLQTMANTWAQGAIQYANDDIAIDTKAMPITASDLAFMGTEQADLSILNALNTTI